eukprot:Rmarinus@m.22087
MANSSSEAIRVIKLKEEREKRREDYERQKEKIKTEQLMGSNINEKFSTKALDSVTKLVTEATGLQTYEEFSKKRKELEKQEKIVEKKDSEKAKEKKKKKKAKAKAMLSFEVDDEGEEAEASAGEENPSKKPKLGKNPEADTSFLPDQDRENSERERREQLRKEWIEDQQRIKDEPIEITYSYWDGRGHRRTITLQKGTTISTFLDKVRLEFPELRGQSVDGLMYIKEDLIIPHHFSFHDLIVMKARGKSGPLFDFGVHDDVRVLSDVRKEKQEAHAGKVVERRWYERHKHIFPASRWEVFEPGKDYGDYTIHDSKKEAQEKAEKQHSRFGTSS